MTYTWVAAPEPDITLSPADLASTGIDTRFETQTEAEHWLSATFEELVDLKVASVSLFNEDHLVYGPMPLID